MPSAPPPPAAMPSSAPPPRTSTPATPTSSASRSPAAPTTISPAVTAPRTISGSRAHLRRTVAVEVRLAFRLIGKIPAAFDHQRARQCRLAFSRRR